MRGGSREGARDRGREPTHRPRATAVLEGGPAVAAPEVWIVDVDQWTRACLRAELIERGFGAVGFVALRDALRALAVRPRPRLLVVDLRGQEVTDSGMALLARLGIATAAIAGGIDATAPAVRDVRWCAFWRRPVTLGEIADGIERLLVPPSPSRQTSSTTWP